MTLPTNAVVDQDELQMPKGTADVSAVVETRLPITVFYPPSLGHDSQPLPPELLALFDRLAELGRAMRNPGRSNGTALEVAGIVADTSHSEASVSDAIAGARTAESKGL